MIRFQGRLRGKRGYRDRKFDEAYKNAKQRCLDQRLAAQAACNRQARDDYQEACGKLLASRNGQPKGMTSHPGLE